MTEEKFDPAKYDPANVPPGWMPPESDLPENPAPRKGDDPVTKPVTNGMGGAAKWITALFALALLARAVHGLTFYIH